MSRTNRLLRALEVVDAIRDGCCTVKAISERMEVPISTAYDAIHAAITAGAVTHQTKAQAGRVAIYVITSDCDVEKIKQKLEQKTAGAAPRWRPTVLDQVWPVSAATFERAGE
jgi:predicted transcriptional regulator